ncbi:MAG: hypothetical protein KGS72_06990 [Cyanobacteria bacterium REEB67]|nr:hypothetical protein [Cyanobacteria bacterium REEB67]
MSEIETVEKSAHNRHDGKPQVKVISFGFKKNDLPNANLMLDVRFLKNPYWVEELRPLNGKDERVRNYVMEQDHAKDFVGNLLRLLEQFVPALLATKTNHVTIAIGCTGGQHRSVAVVEALSQILKRDYPNYHVIVEHRELGVDGGGIATAKAGHAGGPHPGNGTGNNANGSERRQSGDRRSNSDRRSASDVRTAGGGRADRGEDKMPESIESGVKQ